MSEIWAFPRDERWEAEDPKGYAVAKLASALQAIGNIAIGGTIPGVREFLSARERLAEIDRIVPEIDRIVREVLEEDK